MGNRRARQGPVPARVMCIRRESDKVKSMLLRPKARMEASPGQFVMLWIPGMEEIPISVSGIFNGAIRVTIARSGPTTSLIHERVGEGDVLFVRGPLGRGFDLKRGENFMLVGGGYGISPLVFAAKVARGLGKGVVALFGARTSSELIMLGELEEYCDVYCATDDGTLGIRGMVTDVLKRMIGSVPVDAILTCGPELMMYRVAEAARRRGIRVQACLERYVKCGIGICGSCVLDPLGLRVCTEGPVFDGCALLATDFGKYRRDAMGLKVAIA